MKELRDLSNRYRIHMGRWRAIYRVNDEEMTVLIRRIRGKQGPETYRDIE